MDGTLTLTGGNYDAQRYVGTFAAPEGTKFSPDIAGEVYYNRNWNLS